MATKYTKKGSVVVNGIKKAVYCKEGSTKKYVVYKKRHMSLTRYKKIKSGTKKVRKTRGGDDKEKKEKEMFLILNSAISDFIVHEKVLDLEITLDKLLIMDRKILKILLDEYRDVYNDEKKKYDIERITVTGIINTYYDLHF